MIQHGIAETEFKAVVEELRAYRSRNQSGRKIVVEMGLCCMDKVVCSVGLSASVRQKRTFHEMNLEAMLIDEGKAEPPFPHQRWNSR